ncbi:MAG: site-specific DNA-methyltransferase [Acidimicrobiia bacterium]
MTELADNSVALVVTSPPYFAGKAYEEALGEGGIPATYVDYREMLKDVFAECARKLEPGGRIAVNVANLGRKPYRSLSSDVIDVLQELGLLLRGEVIWQKARGAGGSCAWGSFQRPGNPVLRDLTERIVIASKGRFDRALSVSERSAQGLPSRWSLSKDEFMEATTDVWEISPESATRVGHPAPFPVELPERLIHLYTYYDDLVLDPFMGSGTTAVAAVRTGRHYAGYDTDAEYVDAAKLRVEAEKHRLAAQRERSEEPITVVLPALPSAEGDDADDFQRRAGREGRAAKEIAEQVLHACGFTELRRDVKFPSGVEVNFEARDSLGKRWFFDVSGGFTSSRPGLKRTDTLWKALGKALVLSVSEPKTPLVLLTTHVPPAKSAGASSLDVVSGPGKPIHAVIEMLSPDGQRTLRGFAAHGSGAHDPSA